MIIEAETRPGDSFFNQVMDVDLAELGDLPFVVKVRPEGRGWIAELVWDDEAEPDDDGKLPPLPSVVAYWRDFTGIRRRYRNSSVFYGRTIRKAVSKALKSALSVYEELLTQAAEASVQKAQEISVP